MQSVANISIGRFDNLTNFQFYTKSRKVRLWSSSPKSLSFKSYTPISSDGKRVCFGGKVFQVDEFSSIVQEEDLRGLIVLTNKEKLLLLEQGVAFAFDVDVLEVNFPIFPNLKFSQNLINSFEQLKHCLMKIRKLNIRGNSLGQQIVTEGMYRSERKLRCKNILDSNFFFANLSGYQEVFKLKEERQDRVVIALDYNSMYASCMEGDFLDPSDLEYRTFNQKHSAASLPKGFFRVNLSKPRTEHISNFHSFKYACALRSYPFQLNYQDKIELLLFDDEIEYYQRHFDEINIIDGMVSKRVIKHPLFSYASKLYSKRLKASKDNNETLASLLKFKLAMLHSATNKAKVHTRLFDNYSELQEFVSEEFFISSLSDFPPKDFLELLNESNYFSISFLDNKIQLKYRDYRSASNLFSLSAKILANARLKMTKTLEFLNNFDDLEVCYVNIDSVHVSIPRERESSFFDYTKGIVSDKMGDLKIQTIADRGYWLDVGRYWLVKDDTVKKFANTGFNSFGNINPFISKTKKLVRFKSNAFDLCKPYYSTLEGVFSFKKQLLQEKEEGSQNYERFTYEQISTLTNMLISEQKETLNSLQIKCSLFNFIRSSYEYSAK